MHCEHFIGIRKSILEPTQDVKFLAFLCSSTDQAFLLPEEKKQKFEKLKAIGKNSDGKNLAKIRRKGYHLLISSLVVSILADSQAKH